MATRFNVDPGGGPVEDVPWQHYRAFLAAAAMGCGTTSMTLLAGEAGPGRAILFGAAVFLVLALVGAVLNELGPRFSRWTLLVLLGLAASSCTAFVYSAGTLAGLVETAAFWIVGAGAYFAVARG